MAKHVVIVSSTDGSHKHGPFMSHEAARRWAEVWCSGTIRGVAVGADWLSPNVAIGPFGERLVIEQVNDGRG